jgi:hypothetical protein
MYHKFSHKLSFEIRTASKQSGITFRLRAIVKDTVIRADFKPREKANQAQERALLHLQPCPATATKPSQAHTHFHQNSGNLV